MKDRLRTMDKQGDVEFDDQLVDQAAITGGGGGGGASVVSSDVGSDSEDGTPRKHSKSKKNKKSQKSGKTPQNSMNW